MGKPAYQNGGQFNGNEDKGARDKSSVLLKSSNCAMDENFTPIKALTTFSRDWVIKARIVHKSDLKNTRNGGKLLKLELVDSMNTHIEATFFNDSAEHFFPMVQ
jgi:DNA polymerase III alpha subunit (gram-positive type)